MSRNNGLTLRRAQLDRGRSSAGYWWVEQLPGAAVVQDSKDSNWRVLSPLGDEKASLLLRKCNIRGKAFPSRAEALSALSLAIEIDRGF